MPMNPNDPFAALMSASTAAAAMDTAAAAPGSLGMGDDMATAAALAVGDFMKAGVSATFCLL